MISCSRWLTVTWLVWLAACSATSGQSPGEADKMIGERLIAITPSAWKRIYQINTDQLRISDFIPPEENAVNWTRKISFESHPAGDLLTDPIEVLKTEAKRDEEHCSFVQHFNIFSGYENGYETSVRLFHCGENEFSGRGEVKLIKAIRGQEHYYFVKLVARMDPFDPGQPDLPNEVMADWSHYLKTVHVCDDSVSGHPCEKTGTADDH